MKVSKNCQNKWNALSYVDVIDNRKLRISTTVDQGEARTYFQEVVVDGNTESFVLTQSFRKVIRAKCPRGTEKSVSAAHTAALVGIDAIVAEALAFGVEEYKG